ncbi:MAG: hypothetical protein KDA66_00370 [Planctomycetaceae bacterium]|nr:hypothetical protein [Planctomycetaceae bacterium]
MTSLQPTSDRFYRRLAAVMLVVAVLQIVVLWGTSLPLGVPGEWTWGRISPSVETLFGLVIFLPIAVVYVVFVKRGYQLFPHLSVKSRRYWLTGLFVCSLIWTWGVLQALPGVTGLGRGPLTLYLHGASGYYTQARTEVDSIPKFLKEYPGRISDADNSDNYLHVGTHPPGLTVSYALLRRLCDNSTFVRSIGTKTQPRIVREVFDELASVEGQELSDTERATLWIACMLTTCICMATVYPLYWLISQTNSAQSAWLMAAVWPLIPAILIFLPKSDLLFPLLAVTAQAAWLSSLNQSNWRHALIAGACLSFGMYFSLALVPVGAILFIQLLARLWSQDLRTNAFRTAGWGIVGFLAPIGLAALAGTNLPWIWYLNYHNHAAFYAHFPRTYLAWLAVNPLELLYALGMPLVIWGIGESLLMAGKLQERCSLRDRGAVLLIWGLLWLTGKNMGEAARLWCFLMPLGLWVLAPETSAESHRRPGWWVPFVLAVQIVTCFATVCRVKGLDFGG